MRLPENQQPLINLRKIPRNLRYKYIAFLLGAIIGFFIPLLVTAGFDLPQSEIYHNIPALIFMWIGFGFIILLMLFKWIAFCIDHLKIYESGVVLRSSVFLVKRFVPYDQILYVKLIDGFKYEYPTQFLVILTKKLNRFEIWIDYIPDYKEALLIIDGQLSHNT